MAYVCKKYAGKLFLKKDKKRVFENEFPLLFKSVKKGAGYYYIFISSEKGTLLCALVEH